MPLLLMGELCLQKQKKSRIMANQPTEPSTSSARDRKTWSAMSFYGSSKLVKSQHNTPVFNKLKSEINCGMAKTKLPSKYTSILGPSRTWRVFRKQQDALEFAQLRRSELMTFVYEESNGSRLFIVAHPIFFWYNCLTKPPEDRCSYEIIPDKAICKLYFDLEFLKECNPGKDGIRMTNTFIFIIGFFLKKYFQIQTNRSCILDLDSSTDIKFSRHLIYQLSKVVFRDNLQIKDFVKSVCATIREWIQKTETRVYPENIESDIKSHLKVCDLHELVVTDSKGNCQLFCDESVYTKNRHFRLMGSTKRNKNAHLVLSSENKYSYASEKDSPNMFLDSLLTYFPPECLDFKIITFEQGTANISEETIKQRKTMPFKDCKPDRHLSSPHPEIDKFILSLVTPGRIYRCFFISSSHRIVYEIVGYRYCGNIQREHRSNNIKFVVNINSATYFQTCFDHDCASYRSNELKLPQEIAMLFNKVEAELESMDNDSFEDFGIPNEELDKIFNAAEKAHLPAKQNTSLVEESLPTSIETSSNIFSEITDEEMIETMEKFEHLERSTVNLSEDHQPLIAVQRLDCEGESCDAIIRRETDEVKELLENSDNFFESTVDFLDSTAKNVANVDNDMFAGDLNEVELNKVMFQIEQDPANLKDNCTAVQSANIMTSEVKSQNIEQFPDFGLSDLELLSVVYPKT